MSQIPTENAAMRAKAAAAYLGIGQSTFWRWVQLGKLPKGKRLSARCTVWLTGDLKRFLVEAE